MKIKAVYNVTYNVEEAEFEKVTDELKEHGSDFETYEEAYKTGEENLKKYAGINSFSIGKIFVRGEENEGK